MSKVFTLGDRNGAPPTPARIVLGGGPAQAGAQGRRASLADKDCTRGRASPSSQQPAANPERMALGRGATAHLEGGLLSNKTQRLRERRGTTPDSKKLSKKTPDRVRMAMFTFTASPERLCGKGYELEPGGRLKHKALQRRSRGHTQKT